MASQPRTPLIVTVFAIGKEHQQRYLPRDLFYSYCYGLEMQVDNEWELDLVIIGPPDIVGVVTDEVSLEEMEIATAGFAGLPRDTEGNVTLDLMVPADRNWVLYPFTEEEAGESVKKIGANLIGATQRGINVILNLCLVPGNDPMEVCQVLLADVSTELLERVVLCIPSADKAGQLLPPAACHEAAKGSRSAIERLAGADIAETMRIIVLDDGMRIGEPEVKQYVNLRDVDGLVYITSEFHCALDAMHQLTGSKYWWDH